MSTATAMAPWYHLLDKCGPIYDGMTADDASFLGVERGSIPTYIVTLRSLTIKNYLAFGNEQTESTTCNSKHICFKNIANMHRGSR